MSDPSGLTEYSYDSDGHLEMESRTINSIVFVTGYDYDPAGNLDAARSQNFDYDDLYRLTSAASVDGAVDFTCDKVGNRLQAVSGTHAELFAYDADGNTTQRIPGSANPTQISDPADYIYNSSGQRTRKLNTTPVIYHYDLNGQLIAETDATGTVIWSADYLPFDQADVTMTTVENTVPYGKVFFKN